jgi:hypothetical protein
MHEPIFKMYTDNPLFPYSLSIKNIARYYYRTHILYMLE